MSILIKNCAIITQNSGREIIPRGFIVIKGKTITNAGTGLPDQIKKYSQTIDAKDLLVLPGLINLHIHLGETIFRNILKKKFTLENYLNTTNELTKKTNLIEKNRKLICDFTLLSLLRAGNTFIGGGRTSKTSSKFGIKNISGYMVMDSHKLKKYYSNITKQFDKEYNSIKSSSHTSPAIFIHSLNTVSPERLIDVQNIIKNHPEIFLMLHIAETQKQEQEIIKKYNKSSIEVLNKYNLLGSKTLLIHANWTSDNDLKIIKNTGAKIIHCPLSNSQVADKILDLKKIIDAKIDVCLASDGYATSKTFSLIDEARYSYSLCNKNSALPSPNPQSFIDLITIKPAEIIGLSDKLGSIGNGKFADLIFIKKNIFSSENYVKELITKNNKINIHGIMIDGKIKIWGEKNFIINEKKLKKQFTSLEKMVIKKANEHNLT